MDPGYVRMEYVTAHGSRMLWKVPSIVKLFRLWMLNGCKPIKEWNWSRMERFNGWNWFRDKNNQGMELIKGWNWSRDWTDQVMDCSGKELIKGWNLSRDGTEQGMELINGLHSLRDDQNLKKMFEHFCSSYFIPEIKLIKFSIGIARKFAEWCGIVLNCAKLYGIVGNFLALRWILRIWRAREHVKSACVGNPNCKVPWGNFFIFFLLVFVKYVVHLISNLKWILF